ncbi:MAG: peptidoglycan-associated lipoprotein Pal [Lautropia sp.]|nr:peptidoglycan-associated lipoprotein Pal [Lautropia sp.]
MFSTLTRSRLIGLGLGLAILGGCTSVDLNEDPHATSGQDPQATQGDGFQNGQPGDGSNVTELTPFEGQQPGADALDPLNDPSSPLAKRDIFFEFDSFAILPEYQPVIEAHAQYLSSHRDKQIVIEGNTDELGSREYNLALGQKRADAVRRALSTLGVDDAQMESISFGEEKPRTHGTDEQALSQNRRADINYR